MTLEPITVELESEKLYSWCTCGLSQKQPFCDGAHKGTEFRSLKFQVTEAGNYALCCCKKTKNPPYCDGSHCDS
jgi:CDGSH iron-sulfur domain-containing protein 3